MAHRFSVKRGIARWFREKFRQTARSSEKRLTRLFGLEHAAINLRSHLDFDIAAGLGGRVKLTLCPLEIPGETKQFKQKDPAMQVPWASFYVVRELIDSSLQVSSGCVDALDVLAVDVLAAIQYLIDGRDRI